MSVIEKIHADRAKVREEQEQELRSRAERHRGEMIERARPAVMALFTGLGLEPGELVSAEPGNDLEPTRYVRDKLDSGQSLARTEAEFAKRGTELISWGVAPTTGDLDGRLWVKVYPHYIDPDDADPGSSTPAPASWYVARLFQESREIERLASIRLAGDLY